MHKRVLSPIALAVLSSVARNRGAGGYTATVVNETAVAVLLRDRGARQPSAAAAPTPDSPLLPPATRDRVQETTGRASPRRSPSLPERKHAHREGSPHQYGSEIPIGCQYGEVYLMDTGGPEGVRVLKDEKAIHRLSHIGLEPWYRPMKRTRPTRCG